MEHGDSSTPSPVFRGALNQPMPATDVFARAVLGAPPWEERLIREASEYAANEVDQVFRRVEESLKLSDAVLRHMLRLAGRTR